MIDRVDRIQVAVRDRRQAAATFGALLGTVVVDERPSTVLGAIRLVLALGESWVELCEPAGDGIVARALAARGEGLISAGLSAADPGALHARLAKLGQEPQVEGDQFYLRPEHNYGLRIVISPARPARRVGPVSFLYEVTHTLLSDWRRVAAHHAGLFGLDPARFSPIASKRFGYEGTLALFDPPCRLDRIELSQVTGTESAMGRWGRKHGDSLYMCYCETHDLPELIARLDTGHARWTPRAGPKERERDGLWVHPGALHGVLLGVSRTTLAWEWSGRPDLVLRIP